MGKINCTKVYK